MSNTIGHRVSTYSKYALNKKQSDDEIAAKERRRQDIHRSLIDKNPQIATDKKKREERMENCRDAIMNSYLADLSKIFDRFMLWPFVPELKASEAVTAGARLVLFLCISFVLAVIASKSLSPETAKSLDMFNITMDSGGVCLLYTSPSLRDGLLSRMPSSTSKKNATT